MKTVEFEEYIAGWKERIEKEEEERLSLFHKARTAAQRIAHILVEEFGAKRVYLYGSLLDIKIFTLHSDIDIVVEGLEAKKYFKAINRCWSLLPKGMNLDLIPLEDAEDELKKGLAEKGVLLYEK